MSQWILRDPLYLLFLLPLIGIAIWRIWGAERQKASLQFSSLAQIQNFQKTKKGWRLRFAHTKIVLQSIALALVILALARPQSADTKVRKNIDGIDIMICLDISDSMLIEDMKPLNRIEAAKDTIRRFIKSRNSDRIGLIIFAGEAFTLVPLTLDYDLLLSRVDEITTAQEAHIKDGTAIGVALANAANRLKDSTAKSRVLIFATDGENNSGTIDPLTGLDVVKGYGIKVYSIGIGRDGPTKIPIFQKDVFGNKVKRYEPFESTVNEDLLAKMAGDTGGKYYRASREDSLQTVFAEIDKLEKVKIDVNKFVRYTEEFPKVLVWALFLYGLGWLLSFTVLRRLP
jgi:Ca-activated chloride channel family protein